ncbi:MAG: helix-turn-helix domain-containing protein [Clostridium butyricum]|jgi:DNA-binding HxlR family transcriptional regulator|nr:helix-turn-helix domain-containing protein [Clostridium butyricum]
MNSSDNLFFHNGTTYKCSIEFALSIIGGKWKPFILWHLRDKTLRFGELKNLLEKISHKVLTEQLRELEADGIINRRVYTEVPLKVEYSLTEKGYTVIPILEQISMWGAKNASE